MGLTGWLGKELPSASAAQTPGDSDRVAAGGLLGLQDPLPSHGSGFLRMLFGLFPESIPCMGKIEIAICGHDNDAGRAAVPCWLHLRHQGPFKVTSCAVLVLWSCSELWAWGDEPWVHWVAVLSSQLGLELHQASKNSTQAQRLTPGSPESS